MRHIFNAEKTLTKEQKKRFKSCLKYIRKNPYFDREFVLQTPIALDLYQECFLYALDERIEIADFVKELKEKYLYRLFLDVIASTDREDRNIEELREVPYKRYQRREHKRNKCTTIKPLSLYIDKKYLPIIEKIGRQDFIVGLVHLAQLRGLKWLQLTSKIYTGKKTGRTGETISIKTPLPEYLYLKQLALWNNASLTQIVNTLAEYIIGGK